MVALDAAKRAKLIAFVEGRRRMPEPVRARLLNALAKPMVPRAMVDRLEARMAGSGR